MTGLEPTALSLPLAQKILEASLAFAREKKLGALAIAIVDGRGTLKAFAAEEGVSQARDKIALGKASGVIALGVGGRKVTAMALDRPHFLASLSYLTQNGLVPVPGGVLVRNTAGALLGAIGVSGDTSDNDEAAALAGLAAVGLVGDVG